MDRLWPLASICSKLFIFVPAQDVALNVICSIYNKDSLVDCKIVCYTVIAMPISNMQE